MSSGSNVNGGAIDLLESNPVVAPIGTTRIARMGGVTKVSTDGSAFAALSSGSSILARAQALVPAASFDTLIGTDFEVASWYTAANVNGSSIQSVTDKGGCVSMSVVATGGSSTIIVPNGAGSWIDNARTSPWYYYSRAVVGTFDAAAICTNGIGAISAGSVTNPVIDMGIIGAVSATNFAYRVTNGGGSVVASGTGPVLDAAFHTREIYNDGTTAFFLFDGAVIGSTAVANLGAVPMMFQAAVLNGATAAIRTQRIDKAWFACQGN